MKEWLTAKEVADFLNITPGGVRLKAIRGGWLKQTVSYDKGRLNLYHRTCLEPTRPEPLLPSAAPWAHAIGEARLELITYVEERVRPGTITSDRKDYVRLYNCQAISREAYKILGRTSYATYMRWLRLYRSNGLEGLSPRSKGRTPISPQIGGRLLELALSPELSYAEISRLLQREFGPLAPSYPAVFRRARRVRMEGSKE